MTFKRSAFVCGAFAGALAGAIGAVATADAADLGGFNGSIKDGVPALVSQSAARFYGRIDGSYSQYDTPMIIQDQRFDYLDRSIDGNWAVGGGLGYYFNKNVRADITVEHRFETDVNGTIPAASIGIAGNAPGKLGLESTVVMLNGYYDFDLRSRFTPYVGAGIGWVKHDLSAGSFAACCDRVDVAKGEGNDIAAALMAGVAINLTGRGAPAGSGEGSSGDVARNFYLDIGYRFLYLGEVTSGPATVTRAPTAAVPTPVATPISPDPVVSDIHAHEFRIGLRYDFR